MRNHLAEPDAACPLTAGPTGMLQHTSLLSGGQDVGLSTPPAPSQPPKPSPVQCTPQHHMLGLEGECSVVPVLLLHPSLTEHKDQLWQWGKMDDENPQEHFTRPPALPEICCLQESISSSLQCLETRAVGKPTPIASKRQNFLLNSSAPGGIIHMGAPTAAGGMISP